MRDKTKESMRMFLGGRCYTAENLERDYLAEVANYSDDRWEAPQRAADPDLTPLTVKRLCNALFRRTGSQWLIVKIFGEKGRQRRSDDSHPLAVEEIAARYRRTALVGNAVRN